MSVIRAIDVRERSKASNYPLEFARLMEGRSKRVLGDAFGLKNFGVNLTILAPGARSALQHRHSRQDEFVYVLAGEVVVVCDGVETVAREGMCAGFPAGGMAHHIENRSEASATYLEIGDRTPGDEVSYPDDDLAAELTSDGWRFTRKDGSHFE